MAQQFPCSNPKCSNQWHHSPECPNLPGQGLNRAGQEARAALVATPPPANNVDEERALQDLHSELDKTEEEFNKVDSRDYDKFFSDVYEETGSIEANIVNDDGYNIRLMGNFNEDLELKNVYLSGYKGNIEDEREVDFDSNLWDAMQTLIEQADYDNIRFPGYVPSRYHYYED